MATKGCVALSDIFSMLKECLSGWTKENGLTEGRHNYQVHHDGKTFWRLPSGQHGKRAGRGEVQKGHVKALVEHFGIADCARKRIGVLR